MILEFDEDRINNLTVKDVTEWYSNHHTEQDLADVYELVHEMEVYYEDCTYDYEEGTTEYNQAIKIYDEWCALFHRLEDEILAVLRSHNLNVEVLDIQALETFMSWHGYEESGGWFIKEEDAGAD